jgi:hypothetical protein
MMRPLSAHDLLAVWEGGEGQSPPDRALSLLAAACPELAWDDLAALTVGRRDGWLLTLRELTSGPNLDGFVECPRCAEGLEFTVTVADLRAQPTAASAHEATWETTMEGLSLRFRLPNSWDLGAAAACQDLASARNVLVQRCVLEARRDGSAIAASELPAEAVSGLARRMAELDPQADVLLDLRCPACDHSWQALFDIVAFFWTELSAQSKRLLREVHTLARAYGWREVDIISMSARRRQLYLEVVT